MPQPVTVEACLLSWNTSWWGLECHGYYGRLPAPRLGPAHKKKLKLDRLAPSSSANGGAGFAHASVHVKGGGDGYVNCFFRRRRRPGGRPGTLKNFGHKKNIKKSWCQVFQKSATHTHTNFFVVSCVAKYLELGGGVRPAIRTNPPVKG